MALFAAGLPISALGVMADDLWTAVAFISIATSCHQAWSANMFTVASDAFPNRAVGSVVGFGGMLMLLVAGGMLQWLGSFKPLFIFAGVMHPLAWIAIRALVGKNITQIDLDKGLRTAQSPALLAMGLGLMAVGASIPEVPRSWVGVGRSRQRQDILLAGVAHAAQGAGGLRRSGKPFDVSARDRDPHTAPIPVDRGDQKKRPQARSKTQYAASAPMP
jgi:hypothetical protein